MDAWMIKRLIRFRAPVDLEDWQRTLQFSQDGREDRWSNVNVNLNLNEYQIAASYCALSRLTSERCRASS